MRFFSLFGASFQKIHALYQLVVQFGILEGTTFKYHVRERLCVVVYVWSAQRKRLAVLSRFDHENGTESISAKVGLKSARVKIAYVAPVIKIQAFLEQSVVSVEKPVLEPQIRFVSPF